MNTDETNLTGAKILIVDDQRPNLDILVRTLEPHGYRMLTAVSGENALTTAPRASPDLILLDIVMPGLDGFEVCRRLKTNPKTRDIPVIFVTARDEAAGLVTGFQLGGVDYITKPFEPTELLVRVETHLKINRLTQQLQAQNEQLRQEKRQREQAEDIRQKSEERLDLMVQQEAFQWDIEGFVGHSQTVATILNEVHQLQGADATGVLITGESGTGKELIARAIHFGGTRKEGPFVPINCSAIPSELAESMLFGHLKGAFTGASGSRKGCFELADSGTLFLDEIGDMPLELQAKLLRVLDSGCFAPVGDANEKQVDVRVLAATNTDLQAKIAEGTFRGDLYFRLARFTVTVPPLRERKEDIPLLVSHFCEQLAAEMGFDKVPALTPYGLSRLESYHFPGNVRELKNIIEHAVILSRGGDIQRQHLRLIEVSRLPAQLPLTAQPQRNHEEEILAYLTEHGSINNAECRDFLGCDLNRASYLLRKMNGEGTIVRRGERRWSRYHLREAK